MHQPTKRDTPTVRCASALARGGRIYFQAQSLTSTRALVADGPVTEVAETDSDAVKGSTLTRALQRSRQIADSHMAFLAQRKGPPELLAAANVRSQSALLRGARVVYVEQDTQFTITRWRHEGAFVVPSDEQPTKLPLSVSDQELGCALQEALGPADSAGASRPHGLHVGELPTGKPPTLRLGRGPFDVAALDRAGFFRRVPEASRAAVMAKVAAAPSPFVTEVGRDYMADAEELAEGGILEALGRMGDFLQREGVAMEVSWRSPRLPPGANAEDLARLRASIPERHRFQGTIERLAVSMRPGESMVAVDQEIDDDTGYFVHLGDERLAVWTRETVRRAWQLAAARTVEIVNRLLEAHGSAERAWCVGAGHEMLIVFATERQARLLRKR